MADSKISQLASGAPAQAGDEYVVARSGANYKLTLTNIAASMPPIGATTPNTGSFTSLTNSGNLTFSSTGQRITGDMSNATVASRLFFQSSVTNGVSVFGVMPNGTATTSRVSVWNASDPANSSWGDISVTSAELQLRSNQVGTGTYLPMTFYTNGSEQMRLTSGGLGVGTVPTTKLHVVGSVETTFAPNVFNQRLTGTSSATSGNAGAGISFSGYTTGTSSVNDLAFISGIKENTTDTNYAGALVFGTRTNGSGGGSFERMRIDSSGNVGIGTASFGASSQVVLAIANATAVPTGNPTGGGVLYVEAGALKYRGSSGTVTTIANA